MTFDRISGHPGRPPAGTCAAASVHSSSVQSAAPSADCMVAASVSCFATGPQPTIAVPADLSEAQWVALADALDIGLLVVDRRCRLVFANRTGRAALSAGGPLRLVDGRIQPGPPSAMPAWRAALAAPPSAGVHFVVPGPDPGDTVVAIRPIDPLAGDAMRIAAPVPAGGADARRWAIVIGLQAPALQARVAVVARLHRLTPAETRVLSCLAEDRLPGQVASRLGLAQATVRSHLSRILGKTGARSCRTLLGRIAAMPPCGDDAQDRPSPGPGSSRRRAVAATR